MIDLKLYPYSEEFLIVKKAYARSEDVCFYYILDEEGHGVDVGNVNNNQLVTYCCQSILAEYEARKNGDNSNKNIKRAFEFVSLYKQYCTNNYSKLDGVKEYYMGLEFLKTYDQPNSPYTSYLKDLLTPVFAEQIKIVENKIEHETIRNKEFAAKSDYEKKMQICDELISQEKEQSQEVNHKQ